MKIQLLTASQWKSILKWSLYGVLFLFSMLLQSSVLPRMPIGKIFLSAVPVCVACVALEEGTEAGGLYALIASVFYALSGAGVGPLYVFTLTVSAIICGGMSDRFCTKNLISALLLSLISLTICLSLTFLFRVYVGSVHVSYWHTVLIPEIVLSLLTVPLFRLCTWAVGKIGR